jgi:HK97 gp10 family phage protein
MRVARIAVTINDELAQKLSQLENGMDDIIPEILEAGGQVVLSRAKSNLSSSIGRNLKYSSRSTGELASKLGLSPAKLNREGNWDVKVGFAEPHSGGVANALLANVIEHGGHGRPAKPFMKPAAAASRGAAIEAMKAKFGTLVGTV